jgi:uncharacterized protein (DUF934 family)
MPLIKNGAFAADPWVDVADDAPLPGGAPALVSRARFEKERAALLARRDPLGLRLKSDESPVGVGADIHHFALVAIAFPGFRDGRGFSYARRLREQMGFSGDIRAVGHILPDQAQFLDRCGFTEFAVKDDAKLSDWQRGLTEISVFYQRAADARRTVLDLRLQRQSPEARPKPAAPGLSVAGVRV